MGPKRFWGSDNMEDRTSMDWVGERVDVESIRSIRSEQRASSSSSSSMSYCGSFGVVSSISIASVMVGLLERLYQYQAGREYLLLMMG